MEAPGEGISKSPQAPDKSKSRNTAISRHPLNINRGERLPTKDDLPNLKIDFFLSAHETAKDAEMGGKSISSYDIYITEHAGWTPDLLEALRDVSDGVLESDEFIKYFPSVYPENQKAEINMISNSGTAIGIMDLPHDDVNAEKELSLFVDSQKSYEQMLEALQVGDFEGAMSAQKRRVEALSETGVIRNKYMLDHFPESIMSILDAYPDLSEKTDLKVLVKIGAGHTTLVNEFIRAGYDVNREYALSPMYFGSDMEELLKLTLGKEVPMEIRARTLFETVLSWDDVLESLAVEYGSQLTEFKKRSSRLFSFEEIKTYIESAKTKTQSELYEDLVIMMKGKGVEIPGTENELDKAVLQLRQRREAINESSDSL